ncbi:MAG: serine hydrolase [Nitrososphaerota archaeon]|jgi:CubicO group peptidase (beta-lactamase class C family)|nr:serine hydrolase [Nitrososphaerota archaeon]
MSEDKGQFGQVFEEVIRNFNEMEDKNGNNLRMNSIMATSSTGDTYEHYFTETRTINQLRSVSKPIVALALGTAIERGLYFDGQRVNLETLVWPFLKDLVNLRNERNLPRIERVKLKHLMTHTIGHNIGLMFSKEIAGIPSDKLLEYIWNADITHEPGEFFVYSNAGPFLVSVLIQEELGTNLSDWIGNVLFDPLRIHNFEWKNYGKYCAAATGLKLSHDDLHKIGLLLLNEGMFEGTQIVPKHWIQEMRDAKILTPAMYDVKRVFPKYSYGYYLWITKNGTYFADGTNGQYLIVIPRKRMVITAIGNQEDMTPITECMRPFLR